MKTVARLLGLFFLVTALLVLGADLAAAGRGDDGQIMPLGALWYDLHPASLNLVQAVIERYVWEPLWDPVLLSVLRLPAALVFGVLGLLLIGLSFLRLPPRADKPADQSESERPAGASKS